MDNLDIYKFRVGAFVLIALLILSILFVATNVDENPFKPKYAVTVKPTSAPGVMSGTPVRRNGVLIGRVTTVKADDDFVVLEMHINQSDKIYANEIVSIGADGFLGDAAVEIMRKPKAERGQPVSDGSEMQFVAVKRNPLDIVADVADGALNLEKEVSDTLVIVREAGQAVTDAGAGIRDLTSTVQTALQDEQGEFRQMLTDFRSMAQKAQAAIDNFNRIFDNINDFIDDPEMKSEFKRSIAMLPDIFEEVQVTISDTRETINTFREVSEGAESNLENLQAFTSALKDNGPEILEQVNASLKNVDGLIGQINSVVKSFSGFKFDAESGTIGKLLNDTELYDGVLETVTNVKNLSHKLEPLVNDLRTFADSIARDPRQLGVKGAVDFRPTGTGYKGSTTGREPRPR